MPIIEVKSKFRNYNVNLGSVEVYLNQLIDLDHKVFIIDENVWNLYGTNVLRVIPSEERILIQSYEINKTLDYAQTLYSSLLGLSAKRNLTIITIGGGIPQDITGFVASTLYRGINWIYIPTTLLSQADSCIGGKTSLNFQNYKNLIGTFYPPSSIWIDPSFLRTLSEGDFYSGVGEVVKLHIIGGKAKIANLERELLSIARRENESIERAIVSSLKIKLDFISEDEFDNGRRNLLNYGHCFGHGIEVITNYDIPHGQAVVIGMIMANSIAEKRGYITEKDKLYLEHELLIPTLVSKIDINGLNGDMLIDAMGRDKKRIGKGLVLILPGTNLDMLRIDDLQNSEIFYAVDYLKKLYRIKMVKDTNGTH